MAKLLAAISDNYDYIMSIADPRTETWPLMKSPFQPIILLVTYNLFVLKIGPMLMKNREAFNLKLVMALYNITQVLFNFYFVEQSMRVIWLPQRYNLVCEEVDYSNEPISIKIAGFFWLFMVTKMLDLLDTVFMVLRKKDSQISFLHVYHHTCMVIATWVAARYVPGGHPVFFGSINALVHTIMYSYYFITGLYPEYKKNIWWKRHITELQLFQFVITVIHGAVGLLNTQCNYPKFLLALFVPQDVFMFAMFWDFYKKTYLTPQTQPVKKVEKFTRPIKQEKENSDDIDYLNIGKKLKDISEKSK